MPATLAALRRGSASSQPGGQPQQLPPQAPPPAPQPHRSPSQRRGPSSTGSAPDSEADDEFASGDDGDDGDDADATLDEEGTAGEQLRNETTVKSGYLYKRGEKRKNWKKRWFVLRSSKLCYYKNEKEYQLLRFIDMGDVHTVASIELKRVENAFGIVTSSRQYYVRASSRADKESWLAALLDVKEQVRQRSTITSAHERDDGDLPTPSGEGANTPTPQTISVTIPGGGRYDAPARPRAIPGSIASPGGSSQQTGASRDGYAFSPLTTTSLSASASEGEMGAQGLRASANAAAAGASAEQFGLSYASQSSAGQSFGSSPPALRNGGAGTAAAQNAARSPSPHLSSGEVSQSEGAARRRSVRQGSSSDRPPHAPRDVSVGSSGGEGRTTGWSRKPDGSGASATAGAAAAAAAAAGALSSSDEEEEDWDEDEVADLAMPLPGQPAAAPATQAQSAQGAPSASRSTPAPQTPQRATDPNKVIHQGYLMKQSSRRKTWRKRWFVLTGSTLMYTRSHMDAKANRAIPLSSILDALEYTSKKTGQPVGGLTVSGAGAQSPQLHSPSHAGAPFSFSLPSAEGASASHATGERGSDGVAAAGSSATGATGQTAEATSTSAAPVAERGATAPLLSPGVSTTSSAPAAAAPSSSAVSGVTSGLSNIGLGMGGVSVPGVGRGESQKRKKEHCFKILTPKRTFVVCAPTEEEEIKWLSAIQALLTRTRGQTQPPATPTPQAAAPAPAPSATLASPTITSPAGAKTALPARPVRSASSNSGAAAGAAPAQQAQPSAAATLDDERSPNRPRVPSNASHRSVGASQA